MGIRAGGNEVVVEARRLLKNAKTTEELRTAQAVLLPLEFGLNLAQTAQAVGRSKTWVSNARSQFIKNRGYTKEVGPERRGGSRYQVLPSKEADALVLNAVLVTADTRHRYRHSRIDRPSVKDANEPVAVHLKQILEERLGRRVSRSVVYDILRQSSERKFLGGTAHDWDWIAQILCWTLRS